MAKLLLKDTDWRGSIHQELLVIKARYLRADQEGCEKALQTYMKEHGWHEQDIQWAVPRVLGYKVTPSEDPKVPAKTTVTFRMWQGLINWLTRAKELNIEPATFKLVWTLIDAAYKTKNGSYIVTCERVQARDLLTTVETLRTMLIERKLKVIQQLTPEERSTGITHLKGIIARVKGSLI